jgi:hypothetical protein
MREESNRPTIAFLRDHHSSAFARGCFWDQSGKIAIQIGGVPPK